MAIRHPLKSCSTALRSFDRYCQKRQTTQGIPVLPKSNLVSPFWASPVGVQSALDPMISTRMIKLNAILLEALQLVFVSLVCGG